ncbi:MAG: hypothetical protein ABEJ81_01025 [Haloferacaceae archaeon]
MSTSDTGSATLSLSREEAWAAHAALVAHVEHSLADDDVPRFDDARPAFAEYLIGRIEASDGTLDLDAPALTYLRDRLETHLDRGPPRDRPHVRAALDEVASALRAASRSSTAPR